METLRTNSITNSQFNRLPKYVKDYINMLERNVQSLQNEPLRTQSLYNGGEPPPEVSLLLYDKNLSELDLGTRQVIRFRLNPNNPRDYINVRVNLDKQLEISGSSPDGIVVKPVSGNFIYVTVPER